MVNMDTPVTGQLNALLDDFHHAKHPPADGLSRDHHSGRNRLPKLRHRVGTGADFPLHRTQSRRKWRLCQISSDSGLRRGAYVLSRKRYALPLVSVYLESRGNVSPRIVACAISGGCFGKSRDLWLTSCAAGDTRLSDVVKRSNAGKRVQAYIFVNNVSNGRTAGHYCERGGDGEERTLRFDLVSFAAPGLKDRDWR